MSSTLVTWRCERCRFLHFGPRKPSACQVCLSSEFRRVVDAADLTNAEPIPTRDDPTAGAYCA